MRQIERDMARFLTLEEASVALGVGVQTLYRMCRAGRIASCKIGGQWRVPAAAIDSLEERALQDVGR
jgi:excisionase family DNA binding protein